MKVDAATPHTVSPSSFISQAGGNIVCDSTNIGGPDSPGTSESEPVKSAGGSSEPTSNPPGTVGPLLKAVLPAESVPISWFMKEAKAPSPSWLAKEYPPSQTLDYMRCPRFWGLRRLSRGRRGFSVAMEAGSAIHEGLAHYWRAAQFEQDVVSGVAKSTPVDAKEAILVAKNYLAGVWEDNPDMQLDECQALIEKGLKKALATDLLEGGQLIGVEMCLDHTHQHTPIPGECSIADFVHRRTDGGVVITDHKSKLNLSPYYVGKELTQIEYDWQTRHYAYRYWKLFGEVPVERRKHLIVCAPTPKAQVSTATFNEEKLTEFMWAAGYYWEAMHRYGPVSSVSHPRFTACQDYGGCQFQNVCHVTGLEDFFTKLESEFPKVETNAPPQASTV